MIDKKMNFQYQFIFSILFFALYFYFFFFFFFFIILFFHSWIIFLYFLIGLIYFYFNNFFYSLLTQLRINLFIFQFTNSLKVILVIVLLHNRFDNLTIRVLKNFIKTLIKVNVTSYSGGTTFVSLHCFKRSLAF